MQEENNKPAENLAAEGEKVTGGEEATTASAPAQTSGTTGASGNDTELSPQTETKKEEMTSYNEHPDQEKVGGG